MKNCSFASVDQCHQVVYSKKCKLRPVDLEEKTLLELRSQVHLDSIQTICKHHEETLLVRYSSLIKKCADPFKQHLVAKTKSLRIITLDFYSRAKSLHGKVIPGQKLCLNCRISATQSDQQSEPDRGAAQDDDKEAPLYEQEMTNDEDMMKAGPSGVHPSTITSTSTTSLADNEPDISLIDANRALEVLGVSPIKKSKYHT